MFRKRPAEPIHIDWLIVGLGNPGAEYAGTRHNVGFEVIDHLAESHRIKLDKSKHRSRYGLGKIGTHGVAIVKPMTFMNLSGQAVAPLLREFGLGVDRLLIVADDTDLAFGRVRLKPKGSAGGHNGHKSIIQSLGTSEYARLKLGISRVDKGETIDHVLGKFTYVELADARRMVQRAAEACERIVEVGVEKAMSWVNETGKVSSDPSEA
jgi:PTH1 family peptidyl-tRNA hydrolase